MLPADTRQSTQSAIKRPFGVWFSLALLILALCFWAGYKAGIRFAYERTLGSLSPAYHARFNVESSAFLKMSLLRFADSSDTEKLRDRLLLEIGWLEKFAQQTEMRDVSSAAKLNLAIAHAKLAIVERRASNATRSQGEMGLAQSLLRSLGWQECSEMTVKAVGQKELDKWTVASPAGGAAARQ